MKFWSKPDLGSGKAIVAIGLWPKNGLLVSRYFDFSRWSISLVAEKNIEVIIKPVFNLQPKIEPEPPVANVDVDTSAEEETCSRIVLVPKRDFLLGIADLTGEMVSLHILVYALWCKFLGLHFFVYTFWSAHFCRHFLV